jgi:predicted RNase H-like HicB family nuclease
MTKTHKQNLGPSQEVVGGLVIKVTWDAESQCYVSYVPALDDISTFADTRQKLLTETRDLIVGYLKTILDHKMKLPIPRATAMQVLKRLGA